MKSKIDSWRKVMNIELSKIAESKKIALSEKVFHVLDSLNAEETGIKIAMEWADEIFGRKE